MQIRIDSVLLKNDGGPDIRLTLHGNGVTWGVEFIGSVCNNDLIDLARDMNEAIIKIESITHE
jgi:hypothetical protein